MSVSVLRWTARAWSVAAIALVVAFIVGERSNPSTVNEWIGFLFFPSGICAGMALAWRSEWVGGAVTVASFVAFYVFRFVTAGAFPAGWAWLVFAAPGFLFLATAALSRSASEE